MVCVRAPCPSVPLLSHPRPRHGRGYGKLKLDSVRFFKDFDQFIEDFDRFIEDFVWCLKSFLQILTSPATTATRCIRKASGTTRKAGSELVTGARFHSVFEEIER
jgi:hypothetical protein